MNTALTNLPKPRVKLTDKDGNAFFILGTMGGALKKAGWTKEQVDAFHAEATSSDYNHLLATCMKYADVR